MLQDSIHVDLARRVQRPRRYNVALVRVYKNARLDGVLVTIMRLRRESENGVKQAERTLQQFLKDPRTCTR